MKAQAKYMEMSWLLYCEGGRGRAKFSDAKKWSTDDEDISMLIESDVTKALRMNNKSKAKARDDSNPDNESEHVNFEKLRLEQNPTRNANMSARSGLVNPSFAQNKLWLKKSYIL